MNAVRGEEGGDYGVDKLDAIVGLHGNEGTRKLCANIRDKVEQNGSGVRLLTERESPHKM